MKDDNNLCPEGYFGCFTTAYGDEADNEERAHFESCVPHDTSLDFDSDDYAEKMTEKYCPITEIHIIK